MLDSAGLDTTSVQRRGTITRSRWRLSVRRV